MSILFEEIHDYKSLFINRLQKTKLYFLKEISSKLNLQYKLKKFFY
jgi:hypothetical protein